MTENEFVRNDQPIERTEDDRLGRTEAATQFVQHVSELDASGGLVVGVLGPWGAGKTSFVNLAREGFAKRGHAVLEFNPWMFSGAEQLVESFFAEISAELKLKETYKKIGESLEDYGELFSKLKWVPWGAGGILEGFGLLAKSIGGSVKKREGGVSQRRKKVTSVLKSLTKPIVIVLDDIDRLTTTEIREVFRLVRLTASFPNVVYVLAFDRLRVEQALGEQGIPGRDYLEKILQVAIDLPMIPPEVLRRETLEALDAALGNLDDIGDVDADIWPDLCVEIIFPLIDSMRDVKRFALAARGTAVALQGRIALADLLALEAVRVFLPDTFAKLHPSLNVLTRPATDGTERHEESALKAKIEHLVSSAGEHQSVVQSMIVRLFPEAGRHVTNMNYGGQWRARWLRARRVAHEDLLRLYLERVAGTELLAFFASEDARSKLHDRDELDRFLRSLNKSELERVISSLEVFEDEYRPEHVVPGNIVLLNLLPEIPERPRTMFEFGPTLAVTRVTLRLLRSLRDPELIERAVHEILPGLHYLSGKWEVISDVGYLEGRGHKLVSESAASALELAWRAEVRAATVQDLEREPNLLRVLIDAKQYRKDPEEPFVFASSPAITYRLLLNARNDMLSQSMGNRSVHREPRLHWQSLVEIFGSEDALNGALDEMATTIVDVDEDLLALAKRYQAGWRPER